MDKLSGSQVDKLGRRLRDAKTPSVEDLRLLEQVRRAYENARLEVVQALLAEGLQGTSRLKTTSTIIEKLRRESTMHLSRMQDIAGVRLVVVTGEVVDAADGWLATEGGVSSVMVVPMDPGLQGAIPGGVGAI